MVCVEVTLDGSPFRRVGIKDASLITPTVHGFVDDEAPARLELSGMCDLGGERAAHVYWGPDDVALNDGTVVTFRLAMSSKSAWRPNKRLKLAGPTFRGSGRLCPSQLVPQGGALAPAGARAAA